METYNKIIVIYTISAFIYICILIGFIPTIAKISDFISKYFEIFIIFIFLSGLMIIIFGSDIKKEFPICLSLFSLGVALLSLCQNTKKNDSRNIEYYTDKIDNLEKMHKAKLINDKKYNEQLRKLKEQFDKNNIMR
ncbi:hypothetical protein DWZ66_08330 [Coprobacillus sp. AF34-1BH]|nr:hypothetical protein DWZ66_08330 [Coprobacillus sp. AF34-1BH]